MLVVLIAGMLTGCSAINPTAELKPISNQTLEFYPGLVKGFEHTYPSRRILVLAVTNECRQKAPDNGTDAGAGQQIGVTMDSHGQLIQRLYASNIAAITQKALAKAVQEAGMSATTSSDSRYQARPVDADYVLQSAIVKCWVKKQRVMDADKVPNWQTVADFAINAAIYKPPFSVPFWKGVSSETYTDPPDNPGIMTEDDAAIFDQPGQVLSVAFTRSVESIFKRSNLHALITQDRILRH